MEILEFFATIFLWAFAVMFSLTFFIILFVGCLVLIGKVITWMLDRWADNQRIPKVQK
jgi:hypothetical protein